MLGWDETENYLLLSDRIDTQDFTAAIAVDENGGSLKGSGYTTNQNFKVGVTFEPSPLTEENGGRRMKGYAVPDGQGGISEIVITEQGFGYKKIPKVTFDELPHQRDSISRQLP